MKKIGFIVQKELLGAKEAVFRSALFHQVYIIEVKGSKRCSIHSQIRSDLDRMTWTHCKYDILENLCFFPDTLRTQQCDAVFEISEAGELKSLSWKKGNDELVEQILGYL